MALGALGVGLAVAGFLVSRARARAQEQAAAELFTPAVSQLKASAVAPPPPPEEVDLDRTVRILHALDLAVEKGREGPEWIRQVAAQDHRGVPRKVLAARAELLDVLQRLYARMEDQEAQAEYWKFSRSTVLSVLSLVRLDGESVMGVPVGGSVSVDSAQVKRLLSDTLAAHQEERQLRTEVNALEGELVRALQAYAEASWEILERWDRLTTLRDRAYLAARERDWPAVVEAADAAIALSPREREAHLLKALAMVEQLDLGSEESLRRAAEARSLLQRQVDQHPGASAPALLLLGVLESRTGNASAARLDLEQAAVNFPRQSPRLGESLDPYKVRAYLRKSREGRSIMEAYEQTMLGAGYFSPDLQMARLHYLSGDVAAGKAKVMDHFSRRRAQRQWAALAADVQFCSTFLGVYFEQIFPEERWLDLVATETTFGSKLDLKVRNRSANVLRNATLVLVLRFTDMHRDDHETFTAERTLPAVAANAETDFGELEIDYELFGRKKTVKDIVSHRAILVSDEAVTWVDTAPVKQAEEEFRAKIPAVPVPGEWSKVTGLDAEGVRALLRKGVQLGVETALGRDDVVLTLPRELAILKPSFRLRYGGKEVAAAANDIQDNAIRLKFDSVANFEAGGPEVPQELELQLGSRLLSATLKFAPDASGSWVLKSLE
ncbi:MAG: hypothetical protein RL653_1668 [Pseudomonadota bacterium]